jgi:Heparinase II/III-like protein.
MGLTNDGEQASVWKERARGIALLLPEEARNGIAERLRQAPSHASLLAEIEAEANRLLNEPEAPLTEELFSQYAKTGERLSYERVYFGKRKRLSAFAIMALLFPEQEPYRSALNGIVQSICEETTWCLPAHYNGAHGPKGNLDLFASETGFALAELLALDEYAEGALLDPSLKPVIVREIEERLFQPFLGGGPFFWESIRNNWAAVCAGSIGAAALYLMDDAERLGALMKRVLPAMDRFLESYGDDGACVEGYLYWQYGFGYYVYFMSLLKRATGGAIDGFASPKVKQIALFQQRSFSIGDMVVNFSDAMQRSGVFMGLTHRLREEYPEMALPPSSLRAPYASDHCGRWAPAIRNLLWVPASSTAPETEASLHAEWPEETHYMKDAQWLVSRAALPSGSAVCFAAKGGHNAEPHNHNDCGHFMLHADGEALLADLGSGEYTKAYFGPDRYTFWCNGSHGHSVPEVNGIGQADGHSFRAQVKDASLDERETRFVLELAAAYPAEARLSGLERSFAWRKGGEDGPALTLRDRFRLEAPSGGAGGQAGDSEPVRLRERFIAMPEPMADGEGRFVIRGNGRLQVAVLFDPARWRGETARRSDIDHFGRERWWHTLDFHYIGPGSDVTSSGHAGTAEAEFVFQVERRQD